MYECLTRFAGELTRRRLTVEQGGGTRNLEDFIQAFYRLEGFADTDYFATLERYGANMSGSWLDAYDVEHADLDLLRAFITFCIRSDRFCDGALMGWIESGFIDRCLVGLKRLDGKA